MSDQPSKPRPIVVVDTETNGLDPDRHEAVEVAWWNLSTDERGVFIPAHDVSRVLANASVKALQVNRYVDRIAEQVPPEDVLRRQSLAVELAGATLAGSNPSFDAAMLRKLLDPAKRRNGALTTTVVWPLPKPWEHPWHHRLLDLSAYAAGVLGLDEMPGLAKACELLGVDAPDHTAEGDVTATGLCFRALFKLQDERKQLFGVPPAFEPQRAP